MSFKVAFLLVLSAHATDVAQKADGSCDADVELIERCPGLRSASTAQGCLVVDGDLVLDPSGHTDVALPRLLEVTGSLYVGSPPIEDDRSASCVKRNRHLKRVALDGLRTVGGDLRVRCTDALEDVSFASLQTVGDAFRVEFNKGLERIGATSFPALTSTGADARHPERGGYTDWTIAENEGLGSLAGAFPALVVVAQAFVLERNLDLNDIPATAFASLRLVGNFQLTDLAGLAALPAGAFPSLEAVGLNAVGPSDFWLGYNPALRVVEPGAFPSLKRVEGDVWLLFSAALESVAGALPALAEVGGYVHVHSCAALTTLEGAFEGLEAAAGLQIGHSERLAALGGFSNLRSLSSHLAVYGNPRLERLEGFHALEAVGDVDIYDNKAMASVDALGALREAGRVRVFANPELRQISGFESVERIGGDAARDVVGEEATFDLTVLENHPELELRGFVRLAEVGRVALQRIRAPRLCASPHATAQPCYCDPGAGDECFDHAEEREALLDFLREDDDDDDDDAGPPPDVLPWA